MAPDVALGTRPGVADAEAAKARTEAERLSAELEQYKKLAEIGELKAVEYVRFKRGLTALIPRRAWPWPNVGGRRAA